MNLSGGVHEGQRGSYLRALARSVIQIRRYDALRGYQISGTHGQHHDHMQAAPHMHGHPGQAHGRAHATPGETDRVDHSTYVCPMDTEVRESRPGACPKCGMALEPATPSAPPVKTEYVCPMHPEIVRPEAGFCPICGMALEPRTVTLEEEVNPELVNMRRRFWVGVVLSVPIALLAMSD